MFLSRFIASRIESKSHLGFIGFVAKVSGIGVGLGCAALILLLSVMNGFEDALRSNLLAKLPHAEFIQVNETGITLNDRISQQYQNDPKIIDVLQVNKTLGLIQHHKTIKSTQIVGVDNAYYSRKHDSSYDFEKLASGNNVVLGTSLLAELGISIGDRVQLLIPQKLSSSSFKLPKSQWFTVIDSLEIGTELNDAIAIVHQPVLTEILKLAPDASSHIEFVLHDPFTAHTLVREYGYSFDQPVYLSSWFRTHGHLYYDIELVKTVIYIVLSLLICIACFNVISSLVMSVKEQSKSIAILKTMGASNQLITRIFVLKGLKSTVLGAFFGCIVGVLLSIYLTDIIAAYEKLTGIVILEAGVYFTTGIPSKLEWWTVALAFSLSVFVGWLATLYPAKKAAKLAPVNHLH